MKIQIIGRGTVGNATGEGMKRYGHQVWYYDIKPEKSDVKSPMDADIHFICTPEEAVEEAVKELLNKEGLLVIRSTVLPQTTKQLMERYGRHICHNPEFLREAVAEYEFLNPYRIVIGECCKSHGDKLEELYQPFRVPIIRTDPTTSEVVKLVCNAHLAGLISFWNEVHKLCKKLGVNSHVVGAIASLDPRISSYGARMHGKPFGGRCLPKDLNNLLSFCERIGFKPKILKAIKEVNEEIQIESGT